MSDFFKSRDEVLRVSDLASLDVSRVAQMRVRATMQDGRVLDVEGSDAVELVMRVLPSALEGKRLRWVRRAWMIHNTVGHLGMQVLAWLGRPDLGLLLHDATVPRPAVVAERPWMP